MSLEEKILSVLSYFHIFVIIPLLWRKKSDALNSHVYSGISLLIIWSILIFAIKIPFIGVLITVVLALAAFTFTIWGLIDAISGREAKIPGVERIYQSFK